jgi:superfamily II DNA or RNA helicase
MSPAQEHITLRPYQREAIDAVHTAWKEGMQRPAIVLATGMGKGHPLDTEIPTPQGLRKWGDLQAGDLVFGSNGRPTEITGVYDRGVLPAYRVTFGDGSSVVTDADHLWTARDYAHRRTAGEVRTLSTADIAGLGLKHGRNNRWSIPMSGTVTADVELPVGPYTLGALIANGYLSHTSPVLTTPDEHVAERVQAEHEVTRVSVDETKWCPRFIVRGVQRHVRAMGLCVNSADKFIPRRYLEAGTRQRVALLHGLMDNDGSSRAERRAVCYHTTSLRLAEDVRELVCSLGGTASVSAYDRVQPSNGKAYQNIVVNILMPSDTPAFSTPRKNRPGGPRRTLEPRRAVVGVERVEDQEIRCISVAAPDSLYQVTRHHIVTHNTVVFSRMAVEHVETEGTRVVVLVHRDELADQTLAKLRQTEPALSAGKVKAGDNDVHADVMVCSVQTLAREKRFQQLADSQEKYGPVGLVIVDECHHAAAVSYRNILAGLGCFSGMPGTRAIGVTATLARGDGQGLGGVWEDAVYTRSPLWAMARGYLVDVSSRIIDVDTLNLADVKRTAGDYQAKDLGRALMESGGPQIIAKVLEEHAADRRSPIVFTPTVEVARETAAALPSAAYVHGGTPREERLDIYRRFREGSVRTLVNCMVLTEGADFPFADCAVIARPTKSQPLFIQMVGRVLRPSPATGKKDASVLILGGTGGSLCTLIDLDPGAAVRQVKDGETLAEAVVREAEEAGRKVPAGSPAFELTHREIDLFTGSAAYSWLRTPGGVQFIPIGDSGEIALWPDEEPEKWSVVHAPPRGNWEKLHTGLDLGMAMAWAESEAQDRSTLNMTKTAAWRRKPATPKLLGLLAYAGVQTPDGIRMGEASDLFAVVTASRKLDRFVA